MRCFAGSCRFVYNKVLALQKARFEAGEKKLNYPSLCKLLTQWRSETETSWLKDAPTHPLQQALKDLERAYTNFFAAQDLNRDQPLHCMRFRGERRSGRRDQHSQGGTRPLRL